MKQGSNANYIQILFYHGTYQYLQEICSKVHTNRRWATNNRWQVFKDSELWDNSEKKIRNCGTYLYFQIRNYGTYFFWIFPDSELWDLFFGVIRLLKKFGIVGLIFDSELWDLFFGSMGFSRCVMDLHFKKSTQSKQSANKKLFTSKQSTW
jgi:hypothetical protein